MINALKRFFRELRKPRLPSDASLRRALDAMAREALRQGNSARDDARFDEAADHYAAYLRLRPKDAPIHAQHGNMLRETGDLTGAEAAYRSALRIAASADGWLQLARALAAQGRRDAAISALAEALRLEPDLAAAHDELIKLEARVLALRGRYDPWPHHDLGSGRTVETDRQRWRTEGLYPVEAWDAFRRDTPLPPPPDRPSSLVQVVVDATDVGPARVRSTLISLRGQSLATWSCSVRGRPEQWVHSVGSFADIDPRIRFVSDAAPHVLAAPLVLSLAAGVVLDPHALEWFVFAQLRTCAGVVYADQDHHIDHWRDGPRYIDPVLYPLADPVDLASTRLPPDAILMSRSVAEGATIPWTRRDIVIDAITNRKAAHVPRLLSSSADLPAVADRGAADVREEMPGWLNAAVSIPPRASPRDDQASILVVIPTRDQSDLLRTSIRSLYATAARPELVSVVIVDNRSREPETEALLDDLCRDPRIHRISVDAPFNWSRCNNLGAAAALGDRLLFLNNDTEMLTQGWDTIVRARLSEPGTGVVGARLLYPDLTVQHVGMVCGVGGGAPMHEGVGEPREAWGPGGRWRRDRRASAVTGAFMAMRRDVFERVGGFEQDALMIGYNDVDVCFRVRAAGLSVVFVADIEMIHHESKTRGLNDTRGRAAWDQGELKSLFQTWGSDLLFDPGMNLHWDRRSDRPFTAYREPTLAETLNWIDVSASELPWAVRTRHPTAD